MLVESGIQAVKVMNSNLDILVRAKKAAIGVYKRAGFKLVDQIVLDASNLGVPEAYGAYFLTKEAG